MEIAFLLFQRITALDAIGPFEVLSRLPGARVRWIAKQRGTISTDNDTLRIVADERIADVSLPDVVVVPGGWGSRAVEHDGEVLEWIRAVHRTTTLTTSVCTGSLILGAAGLLTGLDATTHWAQAHRLPEFGARYVSRRIVTQGKIVTAAGVSAGIDMGLSVAALLAGPDVAEAIQLGIEYDPEPPFRSGSVQQARPQLRDFVRSVIRKKEEAERLVRALG